MEGIVRAIQRTRWQYFVTLTYSGNRVAKPFTEYETAPASASKAEVLRRRMLFRFLRAVADSFGCPLEHLLFVAREEFGEKNGRPHWHLFLGGLYHVPGRGVQPSPNVKSDIHRLVNLWSSRGGESAGIADVREYDAGLSGAEYIMKGLEGFDWSAAGANLYETGKFVEDPEQGRKLILARAWLRKMAMRSRNRRHLGARELASVSRDRSAPGASQTVPNPARFPHPADPTQRR